MPPYPLLPRSPDATMSPEHRASYLELARAGNARNGRLFFLGLAVFNLVWWSTDGIVLGGLPVAAGVFAKYRWTASTAAFVAGGVLSLGPVMRRPLPFMVAAGAMLAALSSFVLAEVAGPGGPWVHIVYLEMIPIVAVAMSPPARIVTTAVVWTAIVGGIWGGHPAYWADPATLLTISNITFSAVISCVWGVFAENARRQAFVLRSEIEQRAGELRTLNEHLEERVAEKTAELRALAQHLDSAREAERIRIARDLHDELGQQLGALRYAVATAQRRYAADPLGIGNNLDDLKMLVSLTSDTSRQLMLDLRPKVLDDRGLVAAAEWLAHRTQERTGIACELRVEGDVGELPAGTATGAFRLLQEALTNASKHAQASKLNLSLSREDDRLNIAVEDDGVGFERPRSTGMGLVGMRERVHGLGGELTIDSAPGRGTRIRARLPVPAVSAA